MSNLVQRLTSLGFSERQAQSLVDQGIGIMVAVVVIGAVALPVASSSLVTSTNTTVNETHSSDGSLPDLVQANFVGEGHVSDSETLWLNDSFDNELHKLNSSHYTADYSAGEYNVSGFTDLDGDGLPEINSSNDQYLLTYEHKPDGYMGGTTGRVLSYIPLALAVGLFVAAISIVR